MSSTPRVVDEDAPLPEHLQKLRDALDEVQNAKAVADAAQSVTIIDDQGNEVKHLKVRLNAAETVRVMSLPLEQRAAMATKILKERRMFAQARREVEAAMAAEKKVIKAKRKRERQARKRARR